VDVSDGSIVKQILNLTVMGYPAVVTTTRK
jgi:hypothetical protein